MKVLQNKKGFTLIEIIIVIVIIAILAAMLVPAMLKWVDKSRQRTFLSACDSIRTAVTAQVTENFAEGEGEGDNLSPDDWKEVSKLVNAEVKGDSSAPTNKNAYNVEVTTEDGAVSKITIRSNQYQATFNGGSEDDAGWSNVTKVGETANP